MLKKKSHFVMVALMLTFSVLLSACGGVQNASTTGAEATAAPTKEAAAGAGADKAPESGVRTYKTVKGDIKIPAKPKRIVTDYYGGELLSVGANVVGAEPTIFDNPFLKGLLTNTKDVGAPINTEKALELAPDLIVIMYDKNYDALSKIAPTLYIPYGTATNIYETLRLFGDIVGEPEKAEKFIADFDKKAAAGRERLKGVVEENATFGIYELTDKGDLWVFGDNGGRGGQAVYNALKLKMPDNIRAKAQKEAMQLSMEVLPEYATDYMFLTTYDPDKKGEAQKQLRNSNVWKGLKASKNNNVFYNDYETFYRYDPIAITAQIDIVVDMLIARKAENKK